MSTLTFLHVPRSTRRLFSRRTDRARAALAASQADRAGVHQLGRELRQIDDVMQALDRYVTDQRELTASMRATATRIRTASGTRS
jgi:hypothetical protein